MEQESKRGLWQKRKGSNEGQVGGGVKERGRERKRRDLWLTASVFSPQLQFPAGQSFGDGEVLLSAL